jgi:hypothetical protein
LDGVGLTPRWKNIGRENALARSLRCEGLKFAFVPEEIMSSEEASKSSRRNRRALQKSGGLMTAGQ